MNLTYKILKAHLVKGTLKQGEEILIKVDQTLTQDTTGTMVYLQLEALNPDKLMTDLSVAYIDHNTLQLGFENADDHLYIKSAAEKYGLIYSKPGNGICHQLHLERFAVPGSTLLGSDSHTPTAGGIGALAIGSGGLDVAVAMAKGYYYMKVPSVLKVNLSGSLNNNVSAKDIILTLIQKLTVAGGVNKILEYTGSGVNSLSVSDRATICNMGAELGATSSLFPSDQQTKRFLLKQDRLKSFKALCADPQASYDQTIDIDLDTLVPMVAKPHSPDNVTKVSDLSRIPVNQVAIGSCTNASYTDLMKVAAILKDKQIARNLDLIISPGSNAIVSMLMENGALNDLINSGARILEAACGPCIGMGQAPVTKGVSLRTFNRNFKGRCGTQASDVYLASPETAAYSALTGYIHNPKDQIISKIEEPDSYKVLDHLFIKNIGSKDIKTIKGPNIKSFPKNDPLEGQYSGKILITVGDNISTDAIVPSTSKLLPLRSNIPELSKYCFKDLKSDFYETARPNGGIIVGGENYGQGSSREHAALVPLHLGIKYVIAKSFARIHKRNLINSGIVPLEFINPDDYLRIMDNDLLTIHIDRLDKTIIIENSRSNDTFEAIFNGSARDLEILKAGGYINYEI